MKAVETSLQKLMNGAQQFIIPIYQRTYSWTAKQCNQLWKDIITASVNKSDKHHFIGSVVYIDLGIPKGKPQQFLLIDGQQRLTTLSLLLCALARHIEANALQDELAPNKIRNYFLINNEESGEDRYKLLLTEQDKRTLIRILDKMEESLIDPSIRIIENFALFQKHIAESGISVVQIFEGINRLMLVSVALEKDHDNPQLIFESMNSTGKDLSQADLIRNYILMDLAPDEQTRLYTKYWRSMEQRFGQQGYTDYFDWFMRDYLTTQNISGRICKIGEVYEAYKNHHKEQCNNEELLKSLYAYSRYYTAIHLGREDDVDLKRLWEQLRILDVSVSYPFLMRVYNDYECAAINKQELISIIRATISYVVRRVICEIPTNSLNKTFATFYGRINKEKYLKSVLAEYVTKDSYRAFPTDDEVKEKLLTKDVYHLRIKNYILETLENTGHKEPISITGNGLTVEHIMPQNPNLSEDWRKMLGEGWKKLQQVYLHTIGNLTLTAYNSEMSDKPFGEKKTMRGGFIDSHLRINHDIASLMTWGEEQILNRTKQIAEQIVNIWAYPNVTEADIKDYQVKEQKEQKYESIEHYQSMLPEIVAIYIQLDRKILALDSGIRKEYKKDYIAYKVDTNFVDIEPYKGHLKMWLNMPFAEVNDPLNICKDVSNIGHMGNGSAEIKIVDDTKIDYIMDLVIQALIYQLEE